MRPPFASVHTAHLSGALSVAYTVCAFAPVCVCAAPGPFVSGHLEPPHALCSGFRLVSSCCVRSARRGEAKVSQRRAWGLPFSGMACTSAPCSVSQARQGSSLQRLSFGLFSGCPYLMRSSALPSPAARPAFRCFALFSLGARSPAVLPFPLARPLFVQSRSALSASRVACVARSLCAVRSARRS